MRYRVLRLGFLAATFVASSLLRGATPLIGLADEPAHYTFSPVPPGVIVQNVKFYPAGQAMHSQWRAVASRKLLGTTGHFVYDQWYLSIYAIMPNGTYRLQYQSPGTDNFLSVVKKYSSSTWLPQQSLKLVGVGQFVQPAVEYLVAEQQEASADCGGGEVAVFHYNWTTQRIEKSITVLNNCELNAAVIRDRQGDAIQLTGPYYGPTAPMCCPTKAKATAILRYANGKWTMKPNYFTISASLTAHGQ
jgi:hypothetical protein